jgi:uncharacterized protein YukE
MSTGTYVSSAALIDLQQELKALSAALMDLYTTLNGDMGRLAQSWCDTKFEEFQEAFRSRQELIAALAGKYAGWADSYLPPRIEYALNHEGAQADI